MEGAAAQFLAAAVSTRWTHVCLLWTALARKFMTVLTMFLIFQWPSRWEFSPALLRHRNESHWSNSTRFTKEIKSRGIKSISVCLSEIKWHEQPHSKIKSEDQENKRLMNYKYASLHNFSVRIITAAMFAAASVKGNVFRVAKLNYSAADQSKDTKSCVRYTPQRFVLATLNGRLASELWTWLIMLHFRFARLPLLLGPRFGRKSNYRISTSLCLVPASKRPIEHLPGTLFTRMFLF